MHNQEHKDKSVNWEVPNNWIIRHKAEIKRITKVVASLVGLLTLVGIAYQLGELNGQRKSQDLSESVTPITSELTREINGAAALARTINDNSSACGDALVTEWRQGGMYAADGTNYQKLIIFGDYPNASIYGSGITVNSGQTRVLSEDYSFASEFGVWFISDKSPDGSQVPVPECLKDSYTTGWYERDVDGNLRQVTEEEMLCMTLVEGMLTHENHVEADVKCQSYWEK